MARKYGFLTELQFKVLQLRLKENLSQSEVAKILNTTRENVAIIEKRAKRNIQLAKETLLAYKLLMSIARIKIKPNTHLMDIPGIIVRTGDNLGIKLRVNFIKVYNKITSEVSDCIKGSKVIKPFTIAIFKDGNIEVIPGVYD